MSNSNFTYLQDEFSILYNIGQSAEFNLHKDPVTALFKLRQFGEKLTELLFEEHYLEFPYENTFHNRLKTLQYENALPDRVKDLLFTLKNKGNKAVHDNAGSVDDAKSILFSTFKIAKWFYTTYSNSAEDISDLKFSMPDDVDTVQALSQLENDYKELERKFEELLAQREIKEQPVEEKKVILERSQKAASNIEMTEAETRELIDEQLSLAGWEVETNVLNHKKNKTLPEKGRNMAIAEWPTQGKWADYALFIGTELYGIVEAKKYAHDISTELTQAKVYSELAEEKNDTNLLGQWNRYHVPFLFATNGRPYLEQIKTKSGIWFLDIRNERNRSRPLRGWFSPDGLKELLEQDLEESNKKLVDSETEYLQNRNGLSLRDYQIEAIKAVENKIANNTEVRRALLAMAKGPSYYWLAYRWDNLVLSCAECNSSLAKGILFPINGPRATQPTDSTNNEIAQLVDPYFDDPETHLTFIKGFVHHNDAKGKETIEVLKLDDRGDILEERRRKYSHYLLAKEVAGENIETSKYDEEDILEARELLKRVQRKKEPFSGMIISNIKAGR